MSPAIKQESGQGYVTLDSIIKETLFQKGENGTHLYLLGLSYAKDINNELNFDVLNEVKTVIIEPGALRSIPYPEDYVDYVRIGYRGTDGNTYVLGLNKKICLPLQTDDCGNPQAVTGGDPKGNVREGWSNYWYPDSSNEVYSRTPHFGHGGGWSQKGYYKDDKENRCIVFSSAMTHTHIVLEYITDGSNPGKQTMVHKYAVQCIRAGMNHLWHLNRGEAGLSNQWWIKYIAQKRKLDQRINVEKPYELVAESRRNFYQAPKY